jgi:hypothetical protein
MTYETNANNYKKEEVKNKVPVLVKTYRFGEGEAAYLAFYNRAGGGQHDPLGFWHWRLPENDTITTMNNVLISGKNCTKLGKKTVRLNQ